jgi:hypothetical protein
VKTGRIALMPGQVSDRAPNSNASASIFGLDPERISPYVLGILIVYAIIRNLFQAATKPFWYDELCTFLLVHQQRISVMWGALAHGADGNPLGFYLAERFATALVTNENIAFRWLSILGFSCVLVCLFQLIRKRRGSVIALFCVSIPLITIVYNTYTVESRPYSLVLACISLALVCYQRAPAVRWTILMGFSLALAESFHYYAVLSFLPFLAAELVFLLSERNLRWGVWLALACGFIPLAASWPTLSLLRTLYGAHVWSQPSLQAAESSYGWYLGTTFSNGVTLVVASALAVLGTMFYQQRRAARGERPVGAWLHEPILILVFLSLPFVGFVAATLGRGGMTSYYVLPTVLGFPLAAGYVLPRLEGRRVALFSAFTILFLIRFLLPQERQFWSAHNSNPHFISPADSVVKFVSSSGQENLPVVVSDAHDFIQLAHYASPEWKSRFVSIVDVPGAILYMGTDSADAQFLILRSYFPLPIYDFQEFVAKNPVFLLYSSNGGMDRDWWPRKLHDDGYTLRPVAVNPIGSNDFFHRVFLVSRGKDAIKASGAGTTASFSGWPVLSPQD